MSEMNPDPEDSAEDNSPTVPTIEEERHFLAQCEYVNRSITALGRKLRRLLFERGWKSEYSRVDQEVDLEQDLPGWRRAAPGRIRGLPLRRSASAPLRRP